MHEPPSQPGRPSQTERLALLVVVAVAYLALPMFPGEAGRPVTHFQQLADAFAHGRLSLEVSPAEAARPHNLDELIPAAQADRYYCAYPPLPAVLLVPWTVLTGTAGSVATACRLLSLLNVWLFAACLWRLPRALNWTDFSAGARIVLTLFFALGTACWHNAEMGGDWHLAHAVALAAMLLALREFLAADRPLIVGCFVALAVLTRPTAALAAVFFVIPAIRRRRISDLLKLIAAPAIAVLLLAAYNYARFGNPADFGYDRMLLQGTGRELMDRFGQFHPHFVPRNAFWFFLAPPWSLSGGRFPYLGFDRRGLSLFIASPAMLYAFLALRRHRRQPLVRDALLGIVICLVPLLLYFNTGFVQFGHRFSLDYLPLLMILVVAGIGPRPTRLAHAAILVSIAVQAVGVMLFPVATLPPWLAPGP